MKIQFMSDLHTECLKRNGAHFISQLPVSGDVLVLAGDIISAPGDENMGALTPIALKVLGKGFAKKWPHVVYVAGNHEYYSRYQLEVLVAIRAVEREYPNFHPLIGKTDHVTVDGQRFVGGTLWFAKKDDTNWHDEACMNDFRYIKNFTNWVYEDNGCLEWRLRGMLDKNDVMVTHHMPSTKSIAPQYERSRLNRFFVHDLTDLITERQPKLVIHGHTHSTMNYRIGTTQVLCNPKGYPHELYDHSFEPAAVVEV